MKINKKEALALSKVLHQHIERRAAANDDHHATVLSVAGRIDGFLVVDEELTNDVIDDEEDDIIDDECDDDDDDVEEDLTVKGHDLHDLKPATSKMGSLEFERLDNSDVDLLVAGEPIIYDVTYVKRSGHLLEVKSSDGGWSSFNVSRFPKGWASLLPVGDLARVVN